LTKARIIFALVTIVLIVQALAALKPGHGMGFVDGH
jgi:hypothetical protein